MIGEVMASDWDITAWDIHHADRSEVVDSGLSPPVVGSGVQWETVVGGSVGGVLLLLAVVVLAVKRDAAVVVDILQRIRSLLTACITLLQPRTTATAPDPSPAHPPPPHGNNHTDSFLIQWNARIREQGRRTTYV